MCKEEKRNLKIVWKGMEGWEVLRRELEGHEYVQKTFYEILKEFIKYVLKWNIQLNTNHWRKTKWIPKEHRWTQTLMHSLRSSVQVTHCTDYIYMKN